MPVLFHSPCKPGGADCPDRQLGCQSVCPKMAAAKEEYAAKRSAYFKSNGTYRTAAGQERRNRAVSIYGARRHTYN